ncbi:hypothetical protein [Desulfonema limicola]|nr:hypothetical protein [Desulfonema limicola]
MPFNIQGNKSELLTKHIGGLIEHVAEKAKRIIDPFCGTACYIHYLRDEGIEYRPMLQTRHTFATLMIDAGEDIGWVQRMLGHGSLKELEVKN